MKVPVMPPEDAARMFARMNEVTPDTSAVRRKFLNCPYGEEKRQLLDIYLPNEGSGPFPVVFFIHGGAWMSGSRADAQMAPFLPGVERGFAVVSLGYRFVPQIRYPENLFDIKRALRWIAGTADAYLLDPDRVALCGASAGAHLALMAAYTQGAAVYEGAPLGATCRVRAVVDQFGPTDFTRMAQHFDESGYARTDDPDDPEPNAVDVMLGVRLSSLPNMARFLNPIDNVHPDVPPTMILHGRRDPAVPYQQSEELYAKLRAVTGDVRAELYIDEEFLHADPGYASPEWVERIYGFLERHLKG